MKKKYFGICSYVLFKWTHIVFLNQLGGMKGFGRHAIWRVAKHRYNGKKPYIVFTFTSTDGDQGPFFILFSLNMSLLNT